MHTGASKWTNCAVFLITTDSCYYSSWSKVVTDGVISGWVGCGFQVNTDGTSREVVKSNASLGVELHVSKLKLENAALVDRIARQDVEVNRLQAQLASVTDDRDALKAKVSVLCAASSPLYHLELLGTLTYITCNHNAFLKWGFICLVQNCVGLWKHWTADLNRILHQADFIDSECEWVTG